MNYGCHYRGAESLMIEPCHADRISDVLAVVHLLVARKSKPVRQVELHEYRLKGKRKGVLLKEETHLEDGKVVAYSLAYINLKRFAGDNGRVLGFDNSHGYHHRHFLGRVEPVDFSTYAAMAERFIKEVHELWRVEDEEEKGHHHDRLG